MPILDSNDVSQRPHFLGELVEEDLCNVRSGIAEGIVSIGCAVAQGTTAEQYRAPNPGDTIVGFARLPRGHHQRSLSNNQDADGLPIINDGEPISVMDFGQIYGRTEGAPANRGAVFVRTAVDGANTTIGAVAPAAGAGLEALPNAVYLSDASSVSATEGGATVRFREV